MARIDDLPTEDQIRGWEAVAEYLRGHGYRNLAEACDDRRMAPQDLWDEIMRAAGVPPNDMPLMLPSHIGVPAEVDWATILRQIPCRLPLPGPGESPRDESCRFVDFEVATTGQVETSLQRAPDWFKPAVAYNLMKLCRYARSKGAKDDDNLLVATGLVHVQ